MALAERSERSACRSDSFATQALYNADDLGPFPQFELASVLVDIPSDEHFLSMDIQSGVGATLDSSGTLIVREMDSDTVLRREHVPNPYKVFLHPSGAHLFVFSRDGEVHYFAPHDRRVRASFRLQPSGPATSSTSSGAGDASHSNSLFSRSLRTTSGLGSQSGASAFPGSTASATRAVSQNVLVGECVAWVPNEMCGQTQREVANVEYVHALVGCHRDATVMLIELAVGVNGKSPSVQCLCFPSPPNLLPTLPIASVLLEPLKTSASGDVSGCFYMLSNASQLFRVACHTAPTPAVKSGVSPTTAAASVVAQLITSLESGTVTWEVKEYPYVREVASTTAMTTAPSWGTLSVFRPSSTAPVHAYVWANSVGVLHGVLTSPAPHQHDGETGSGKQAEKDGVGTGVAPSISSLTSTLFACEHFIPFGGLGRDDGGTVVASPRMPLSGEKDSASGRDAAALFPSGTPLMVLPMAFHLVLLFPRRCIVLNQPPGLCWETMSSSAAGVMPGSGGGRRREQGVQLAEILSRVRFDPFRNGRQSLALSGLFRDADERKLYVYSERQLWSLRVEAEHRRQWRLFLERAVDAGRHSLTLRARLFHAAHQLAQGQPAAHSLVQYLRGRFFLEQCRDEEKATTIWATCDWFDEVCGLLRAIATPSVLTEFLTKRFYRLARLYEQSVSKRGKASPSASPPPSHEAIQPNPSNAGSVGGGAAGLLPQLAVLAALIVVELLDVVTKHAHTSSPDTEKSPRNDADTASGARTTRATATGDREGTALEVFLVRAAAAAPRLFAAPGFSALVLHELETQGRQACALRLATLTGQHAYVVAYHVALGNYDRAVEVLAKYSAGRPEMAAVWYTHASALMVERPVGLVTAMLRTMFKDEQAGRPQLLDLERLLPAMARYDPSLNEVEGNDEHQVVVLLEQGLARFHCVSTAVHTFYLVLLAKLHDVDRLEEFISASLFYDHNYALRQCLRHGNAQACILLYKQLRLYEDAVKMALRQAPKAATASSVTEPHQLSWPGLSQAEDILRGVGGKVSDETLKRLWLLTAEYAMQQRGVQAALGVVEDSGQVLHLDDVLGKVSDDTVVQELKGVLMANLDRYTNEGATLRRRQDEAYQTAEAVKAELSRLRHQYGYVAGHQRCLLCSRPLLQGAQPYVLYPSCQHVVHESCAAARLEEMGGLEAFFTDEGIAPYVLDGVCSLEELVQVDCVICGEAAVVELDIPLCEEDPSWDI